MTITYDDFVKLDLRVATLLQAAPPSTAACPAAWDIDLGSEKRQVNADLGPVEQLPGKQIVAVANLRHGPAPVAPPANPAQPPSTAPAPVAIPAPAPAPERPVAYDDDLAKIELRIANVLECIVHPNADKLLLVQVDIGTEKRQICAGLRAFYQPEQLLGKQLVLVANLAPRQMRGQISQGMLLAATDQPTGRVVIISPASPAPIGALVTSRDFALATTDAAGAPILVAPIELVSPGGQVK